MRFERLVNRCLDAARDLRGRRVETAAPSPTPVSSQPVQKAERICMPKDWADRQGWDRYFDSELERARNSPHHRGGFGGPLFMIWVERGCWTWFPGCGLDWSPAGCAKNEGGLVLATDFSPVAIRYQQFLAEESRKSVTPDGLGGTLDVLEHDFTSGAPDVGFDVVINHSAFSGLSAGAMAAAARSFHDALKPGGCCYINTINVGDREIRRQMEGSLAAAGFYMIEQKSTDWHREQVDAICHETGWSLDLRREQFGEWSELTRPKFDALIPEYSRRRKEDEAELAVIRAEGKLRRAEVIYCSG